MSVKVAPLGLRLFLEGIEVPVISASVTVQPDTPATAAIQIIPTDMGMHLLPRTLVHLFYLDEALTDDEVAKAKTALEQHSGLGSVRKMPVFEEQDLNRYEVSDFAYKLLYTGEVIGFNFRKTPTGRQLILQCMDLSSYWDTCYQFFADYSAGGSGLTDKHHNFVGAGQGLFDNFGGHQWVISRLINTRPRSPEYQETEGLLGGLIHLLEAVGGLKYRSKDFKGFKGINDFFSIAELRYNLLGQLGAIQADKTSSKLYASKAFNQWIRNGMTSIGTLVSFRDILNHLNRYIFHNIYPNPSAMYVPGGTTQKPERKKAGTVNVVDTTVGEGSKKALLKALKALNLAIGEMDKILLTLDRLGPDGDVPVRAARGGTERFDFNAVYYAMRDADDILATEIPIIESTKASDAKDVVQKLRDIRADVSDARDNFPAVVQEQRIEAYKDTNSRGGKIKQRVQETRDKINGAADALDDLFTLESTRFRTVFTDIPSSAKLYTQLFLPETFFVSPPRCNIIFPDQYFELNFSRNFMREVSRLAMQGGLGMLGGGRQGAKLFSRFYLAPKIRDVQGKLLVASMSQGSRVILQHEVHSGIIPKFSWVTDGHRWGVKAANDAGTLSEVKKTQKIHYLQRLADFQFYLHRWSARQLSLTGVFNPNIVAGLPSAVLNRASPSPAVVEQLEKTLRRRMLPTQFLGKIYSYTHSISQDGGSTSVQLAYARTHRGLDDEFLGVLTKEIMEESKQKDYKIVVSSFVRGTDTAESNLELALQGISIEEAKEQNLGQYQIYAEHKAKLELQKQILRMYAEKKLKAPVKVPGLGKVKKVDEIGDDLFFTKTAAQRFLGISDKAFDDNSKLMTAQEAKLVSPRDVRANVAVNVIILPSQLNLKYTVIYGTGRFERSDVAMEDAIRPEWISEDVWKNENITEAVYKPLLGTMAVTDDKSIGQDAQDELLKRWKENQVKRVEFSPLTIEAASGTDPGGRSQGEGTVAVESVGDDKFVYTVVQGSVEESIDGLSIVYGMIKERGGNVHDFIRTFTRRPIANIIDILGSQNLEFDDNGKVADPKTMIEGFHSRAYGDYNTDVKMPDRDGPAAAGTKPLGALMEGESNPGSVKRPAVIGKDEKKSAIRPEFDPRGRARGRVRAYVEELKISRGLLSS